MFNKFTPLEDGELKNKINAFAEKVNFPLSRIDVMDGSRRSSKSNAYFSGLGKNKRIALFDTLIEKHSVEELVSIIAHEVGHYKKHHNVKGIVWGVVQMGFLFFFLSFFLENDLLFSAFKMENLSVYASLLFFSILYSPIDLTMSFFGNYISRIHEYEADYFAKISIGTEIHLVEGLKKLTVTNLGNLNPHPFTVMLSYSHPPVLERIYYLEEAIEIYRHILQVEPYHPAVLQLIDEVISSYEKALIITPDNAVIHCNLGVAHQELGKLDEAVASHHKALAINSDYADAYTNLGDALLKLGQYKEGLKFTRKGKGVIEFGNDKSRHFQILMEQD